VSAEALQIIGGLLVVALGISALVRIAMDIFKED
jgi:hypothetical protein